MSPFDPPSARPLKPGVAGYWIGGALILVGIAGAVVWLVVGLMGISNAVDDFERVPADGGGTIVLDADRPYVIYVEDGSTSRFATDVRLAVIDPSGGEVDLRRYGSDFNYDFGGRSGAAFFTFRSDEAGDYTVVSESSSSRATVAVGRSLAASLVWTIVTPFVIGGVGLLLGIILVVVTLARRSADKRRRDAPGTPTPQVPPQEFPSAPPGFPPAP